MLGALQRFNKGGQPRAVHELDDGLSVREVLLSLGMDSQEPWNAGLNGALARPSDPVSDGSLLVVFAPVEGG